MSLIEVFQHRPEAKLGIPASILTQTGKLVNEDNLKQFLYILIVVRVTLPTFFCKPDDIYIPEMNRRVEVK